MNRKQKTETPFSHAVGWSSDLVWLVDLSGHKSVRERLFPRATALPVLGERRDVSVISLDCDCPGLPVVLGSGGWSFLGLGGLVSSLCHARSG